MLREADCPGLQSLGHVQKMAMEDVFFFPHLVDLRILILIYRLRFDGFRGCWIQHCSGDGEGVVTSFSPHHPHVFQRSPGALSPHQAVACLVPTSPALSCT